MRRTLGENRDFLVETVGEHLQALGCAPAATKAIAEIALATLNAAHFEALWELEHQREMMIEEVLRIVDGKKPRRRRKRPQPPDTLTPVVTLRPIEDQAPDASDEHVNEQGGSLQKD